MKGDRPHHSAASSADDLRRFADCWNEARFFDAHETLEPRWIEARDRGLRGLIQLAAAFHHLQRGNTAGARTLLERAAVQLADPENAPCDIDQPFLATYARHVLQTLGQSASSRGAVGQSTPDEIVRSRPRL